MRFAGITSDRSWVLKLRFYPLILIFCWSWGTVIKIKDLIDSGNEKKNIDWLSFLNFFFCSLQGTFNAIIYGINSSVKKIIKSHFRFFLFWREKRKLENIKEMTGGVEMRGSFVKNTRAESISSAWSYENERNSIDMSQIDRTINMKEIAEYVLE